MRRNVIETVMGAVVLVVAAFFLVFSYTTAQVGNVRGYDILAKFDQAGGLSPGGDVRISGIKVGSIVDLRLDPETYQAVVRMSIDDNVRLPSDTIAKVTSESLLGGKFLALDPGGDDRMIEAGGEVRYTQSSVNLEDMIGQLIFSTGSGGATKGGGSSGSAPGGASGLGTSVPGASGAPASGAPASGAPSGGGNGGG